MIAIHLVGLRLV